MKTKRLFCAAALAAGVALSGCGPISMAELSSGVSPTDSSGTAPLCKQAPAKMMALMTSASQTKLGIYFNPDTVESRIATVNAAVHPALRNEALFQQLLSAGSTPVHQTHNNVLQLASLNTAEPPMAAEPPPGDLNMSDFLSFAQTLRRLLLDAQTFAQSDDKAVKKFQQAFVTYFSAYFDGKYYDRFGNKIPAPAISTTLGDTEIAGTVTVLVDLVMDFILQTPVWVDSSGKYYPGDGTNQPTALVAFPDLKQSLLAESAAQQCGITPLKTEAIQYVATSAGNRASLLVGTVGGSFGGIEVGLGVLGKISIGDNKTVSTLAKTALQIAFNHLGEDASYRVLRWIPYQPPPAQPSSNVIYSIILQLVQNYLGAQTKAIGSIPAG
ncbi:MAG: hypothetical protein WCD69_09600 [Xanthobacteraceae bacterium]